MAFTKLIQLDRCPINQGVFVEHRGRELAVFRLPGDVIIITDNTCPHAGGNLSGGTVENAIVTCPWHEWEFDLRSGLCVHSDKARVCRYAAQCRDGAIHVDLDSPS